MLYPEGQIVVDANLHLAQAIVGRKDYDEDGRPGDDSSFWFAARDQC